MMKKWIAVLLSLCMLFGGTASAQAPDAPAYQPGSVIAGLFGEAFDGGSMVCADVDLTLELNSEALGLKGEEAEMADAIVEIINTAVISGAAAKTEDALVLSVAADYTKEEGTEGASAGARIGLSKEGLYIETSLLPGERVSATWETVLKLLGADEADVQQILALRDVDPAQLADQLAQIISGVPALIQQVGDPYMQIVGAFMNTLPAEVAENVEAEGYFPAAKTELTLTFTQKAMGELVTQLAAQLSVDPVLAPMLDAVLTNPQIMGENTMTTAALCESIRAVAQEMTDETSPVYMLLGYGEDDALLYTSIVAYPDDSNTAVLNIVDAAADPAEGRGYIVELFALDAAENYSGVAVSWLCQGEMANTFDMSAMFGITLQNTTLMSAEYVFGWAPTTTEENMPAYTGYQSMSMSIADPESGTPVNVVATAEFSQYLTADGGETQTSYGVTDTYVGESSSQATTESYFAAIPGDEGPVGRYVEIVTLPDSGISSATVDIGLYAFPYEPPERSTVLTLEAATQEELDDLYLRLTTNVQPVMDALFAQLPEPILALISGDLAQELPTDTAPAVAM